MAAFHADERGDFAFALNAFDVVGGEGEFEFARIFGDEAMHDIDLFKDGLDSDRIRHLGRDVDGPELTTNAAGVKTWKVSDEARGRSVFSQIDARNIDAFDIVAVFAEFPWEIVMAVDERDFF